MATEVYSHTWTCKDTKLHAFFHTYDGYTHVHAHKQTQTCKSRMRTEALLTTVLTCTHTHTHTHRCKQTYKSWALTKALRERILFWKVRRMHSGAPLESLPCITCKRVFVYVCIYVHLNARRAVVAPRRDYQERLICIRINMIGYMRIQNANLREACWLLYAWGMRVYIYECMHQVCMQQWTCPFTRLCI